MRLSDSVDGKCRAHLHLEHLICSHPSPGKPFGNGVPCGKGKNVHHALSHPPFRPHQTSQSSMQFYAITILVLPGIRWEHIGEDRGVCHAHSADQRACLPCILAGQSTIGQPSGRDEPCPPESCQAWLLRSAHRRGKIGRGLKQSGLLDKSRTCRGPNVPCERFDDVGPVNP